MIEFTSLHGRKPVLFTDPRDISLVRQDPVSGSTVILFTPISGAREEIEVFQSYTVVRTAIQEWHRQAHGGEVVTINIPEDD